MSITKVKASNNMDKSLFEQARPILEQIQDNGFEAYYVGKRLCHGKKYS